MIGFVKSVRLHEPAVETAYSRGANTIGQPYRLLRSLRRTHFAAMHCAPIVPPTHPAGINAMTHRANKI